MREVQTVKYLRRIVSLHRDEWRANIDGNISIFGRQMTFEILAVTQIQWNIY